MAGSPPPPPGWYPQEGSPVVFRWWDGTAWGPATRPGPAPSGAEDVLLRWTLPVGRSGWAIAAGYAGIFAVLIGTAPIAVLLGLLAMRDLRRRPEKLGWGRATFGVVMGSLGTLVLLAMLIIR